MTTYSEHEQRMLDIKSGEELDRIRRIPDAKVIWDEGQNLWFVQVRSTLYGPFRQKLDALDFQRGWRSELGLSLSTGEPLQ